MLILLFYNYFAITNSGKENFVKKSNFLFILFIHFYVWKNYVGMVNNKIEYSIYLIEDYMKKLLRSFENLELYNPK